MTNMFRSIVVLTGVAQLACGDGTGPPSLVQDLDVVLPALERTGSEAHVETIASERERPEGISPILLPEDRPEDGEGGELPPEWQTWPTIQNYWTATGFRPGYAYGQGFMSYFASHARQQVQLQVHRNGSELLKTSGISEESALLPWFRDLWTDATVGVSETCGQSADASTEHSAWHQPPLTIPGVPPTWGRETRSSKKSDAQSPCTDEIKADTISQTEPGPGPGDGDGGGGAGGVQWYTCYYYVEYVVATGEITYSAFLGCAGMGGA